ncbi:MAG TPA: dephospho-CoA kinase [Actinobacteria bacterium]|nr:dephospho-CoA kinase [Actinomycetota bacterium]
MLTVGLTGGIASGKSTITKYLSDLGAVCVDADLIARDAMVEAPVYSKLVEHFGPNILSEPGEIDRAALAAEVFSDPDQLRVLNGLVHPVVIDRIKEVLGAWSRERHGIGIVQVPLLIEAGMTDLFDVIVVVITTPEMQVNRLTASGLSFEEAEARLRSQLPGSARLPFADLTIINKASLELLKEQTAILYDKLKSLGPGEKEGETTTFSG